MCPGGQSTHPPEEEHGESVWRVDRHTAHPGQTSQGGRTISGEQLNCPPFHAFSIFSQSAYYHGDCRLLILTLVQMTEEALFTLKYLNTRRAVYEIPEALYSSLPYTLHLEEAKLCWETGQHPLALGLLKSLLQTFTGVRYHAYQPLCAAGLLWRFIALCVMYMTCSYRMISLLSLLPSLSFSHPFSSSNTSLQRLPPSIPQLSVSTVTGWQRPTQRAPPSS